MTFGGHGTGRDLVKGIDGDIRRVVETQGSDNDLSRMQHNGRNRRYKGTEDDMKKKCIIEEGQQEGSRGAAPPIAHYLRSVSARTGPAGTF